MSKKHALVCLLCLLIGAVYGQLSWQEPLVVGEYANLSLKQQLLAPDGTQILFYTRIVDGAERSYMQAYSPESVALWAEPVALGYTVQSARVCLTSLGEIAIFAYHVVGSQTVQYLNRYDLQGHQIGSPNQRFFSGWVTNIIVIPDNVGGIHVLAKDYNGLVYQYVNSSGAMLHPLEGGDIDELLPENNNHFEVKQAAAMNDGSLLIAYTHNFIEIILCFDQNLQMQFRKQGSTESWGSSGRFALRSDGGFYVNWTTNEGCEVQSCSPAGEDLWESPISFASASSTYRIMCNTQDQLFLDWWSGDIYKAQCLNQDGALLWPEGGLVLHSGPRFDNDFNIYPDGDRGYYVLRLYEKAFNKSSSVFYLNSDGTIEPWESTLIEEEWYDYMPLHSARVEKGILRAYYYCRDDKNSMIAYNEISRNGTRVYPLPGEVLISGLLGYIKSLQVAQLGPNRALALWKYSDPEYDDWGNLQCNVIDPATGWVFEEPINITNERLKYQLISSYPTEDGAVIVVWQLDNKYFAHKLDSSGHLVWPEAKLILNPGNNDKVNFSYYNNSLYMVVQAYQTDTIYLQRFIDGEPVWSGAGKLVASPNSNYPGTGLIIGYFKDGILIWGQQQSDEYCYMYFIKKLNQDGEALEPYSEAGLPVSTVPSEYLGLHLYGVSVAGDRVWLDLGLAELVNVGGHSYDDWIVRFSPVIQSISDQGDILYPNGGWDVSGFNIGSIADEGGFYKAAYDYQNKLRIYKYEDGGAALWNVAPLGQLAWYVSYYSGYELKLAQSAPNELIGFAQTASSGVYYQTYFIIGSNGQVTEPADKFIHSSGTYENNYNLTSTRMGIYFTMYSKNGNYGRIQFRASGEEPIPDPVYCFSIARAYPNPFGGELKLELNLETPGYARLEVFNIRGQKIQFKEFHDLQPGRNLIVWDGKDSKNRDCASGIYFIKMTDGKNTDLIRTVRLK